MGLEQSLQRANELFPKGICVANRRQNLHMRFGGQHLNTEEAAAFIPG